MKINMYFFYSEAGTEFPNITRKGSTRKRINTVYKIPAYKK
jgi:hypothetical protein